MLEDGEPECGEDVGEACILLGAIRVCVWVGDDGESECGRTWARRASSWGERGRQGFRCAQSLCVGGTKEVR